MALGDHKRLLGDHAKRVMDSHRLQMKELGMEVDEEDGDMGDVFVCGDITQPAPTTPPQPASAATQKILPYVLAAALAGGGLGVGAASIPILLAITERATPVVQPAETTDTDTQYELRISKGN